MSPRTSSHLLPLGLLCLVTLTHCVTSDPTDQQDNDDNIRTIEDQGDDRADMRGAADMPSGVDMASPDQGVLTPDMPAEEMDAAQDMPPVTQDMPPTDMGMTDMAPVEMDMAPDMTTPPKNCRRSPDTDTSRIVVAARPYTDAGGQANTYEVLQLDLQGVVKTTGTQFTMGRAFEGKIHFTPDGEIGVVRQEDGTLGIFKIDSNNAVTVIDPAFAGIQAKINPNLKRYFSSITMTRDGSGIIATNSSWRNVGGSVWYIPLDCATGFPGQEVQIAESKLARHVQQLHNNDTRMVVASHDILAPMMREDAHLIDISTVTAPTLLGSGRVFPDDDASHTAMAISEDDRYVLLGDANLFGGPATNNRVGVMSIGANGIAPVQVLRDIRDPADIVVSPYGNAAIVSSFEGNALVALTYDANNTALPFTTNGTVRTTTTTLLPSTMVMVRRGMLTGAVVIAENTGIRTVLFTSSGDILELNMTEFGEELSDIVGALGVQP